MDVKALSLISSKHLKFIQAFENWNSISTRECRTAQEHHLTSTLHENLANLLCKNLMQTLERILFRPRGHTTDASRIGDSDIAADLSRVVLFLESESGNDYLGRPIVDDGCVF